MGGIEPPCKKLFNALLQDLVYFFDLSKWTKKQTKYPNADFLLPHGSQNYIGKFIIPSSNFITLVLSYRTSDRPMPSRP
ncbi:MAG: hypothetical protein Athens071416_496 [Parcubacteria group bacterium Athens0714_16]|nr:MAG: hypothetical protein Athens071416_496 [Parcubacteria group bacterium Athens0714_16]